MDDVCIGRVSRYYGDLHVAVVTLTDMIHVGDYPRRIGHTTDFVQPVVSLQSNHRAVQEAGPGEQVALTLSDLVHVPDSVYRLTVDEAKELEEERMPHEPWWHSGSRA
jgi:hypothetical protein